MPLVGPCRDRKFLPNAKRVQPVDATVGEKIRLRRKMMGMSQTALAEKLGVTFQQVQKYEKGKNRVSASSLHKVAEVLRISVSDLFDGSDASLIYSSDVSDGTKAFLEFISTAEGLRLNKAFALIADRKIRQQLIELVRVLGDGYAADGSVLEG